ncbi:RNA-directed DNA polymerase [Abeliophyllum distichum]|uniref:RNA-directed DNA polymerase n=1 Tax=Abeliophyllum distichum TaxID=126358 RepID=A0ABD1S9L0_9LAMI
MEEDKEIPLIVGRPFLATARALIDVYEGTLTLRVDKEQVTFNVFKAMKHLSSTNSCFQIDVIDRDVKGTYEEYLLAEPLEACIVRSETTIAENIVVVEMAQNLVALPSMAYKRNWLLASSSWTDHPLSGSRL